MLVAGGWRGRLPGDGCDMLVAGGWRGWLPGDGCDMLVAGVGGMGDYRAGVCCDMLVAGGGREVIFVAWNIFLNLWSKTLMT